MARSLASLPVHNDLYHSQNWHNTPRYLREKDRDESVSTLASVREKLKEPNRFAVINTMDNYKTNYISFNADTGYSIFDVFGVGKTYEQ
jgi:hypothetical protein